MSRTIEVLSCWKSSTYENMFCVKTRLVKKDFFTDESHDTTPIILSVIKLSVGEHKVQFAKNNSGKTYIKEEITNEEQKVTASSKQPSLCE